MSSVRRRFKIWGRGKRRGKKEGEAGRKEGGRGSER